MRTKENDTKKNCLKTVWGFKMSFFEEQIEFNFRFSLKPDVCLGSLAQMYDFRVSLYKNLMNLLKGRAFDSHSRGRGIDTSKIHVFFMLLWCFSLCI